MAATHKTIKITLKIKQNLKKNRLKNDIIRKIISKNISYFLFWRRIYRIFRWTIFLPPNKKLKRRSNWFISKWKSEEINAEKFYPSRNRICKTRFPISKPECSQFAKPDHRPEQIHRVYHGRNCQQQGIQLQHIKTAIRHDPRRAKIRDRHALEIVNAS